MSDKKDCVVIYMHQVKTITGQPRGSPMQTPALCPGLLYPFLGAGHPVGKGPEWGLTGGWDPLQAVYWLGSRGAQISWAWWILGHAGGPLGMESAVAAAAEGTAADASRRTEGVRQKSCH
jgi:hypothetical protein